MSVDFSRLGKIKMGDVPRPPVEPQGTYHGTIRSWKWAESRWKNKETGQTEAQVHFTVKPTEFGDNIEDEARVGINLADKIHVLEVPAQSDAHIYYIQELLRSLGIPLDGTKDLHELLPETINAQVSYDVVHKDGERGTIVNTRRLRARVQ